LGSKSGRIRPFEGLAFLISPMSANWPAAIFAVSASANGLTGGAARAAASAASSGSLAFAAATSPSL
jgi:hypothetical protein